MPQADERAFKSFLETLAYPYVEESANPVYSVVPALKRRQLKLYTKRMAVSRSLIAPTSNPLLERSLLRKAVAPRRGRRQPG